MEEKKTPVKEYKKDDLTVLWDASKCIHAGECVKSLPNVYDPKARPWIKPENASVDELKKQIDKCPSAALSYREENEQRSNGIKVHARMNGSLLIEGDLEIIKPDGSIEHRSGRATFCRCGASQNMPFCDSNHKNINFEG